MQSSQDVRRVVDEANEFLDNRPWGTEGITFTPGNSISIMILPRRGASGSSSFDVLVALLPNNLAPASLSGLVVFLFVVGKTEPKATVRLNHEGEVWFRDLDCQCKYKIRLELP